MLSKPAFRLGSLAIALNILRSLCYAQEVTPTEDEEEDPTSVGAGRKPVKSPDFIECNNFYSGGRPMDMDACNKAFDTIPGGLQFVTFAPHKTHIASDVKAVPAYYYDDKDDPKCVITIDLAGKSWKNNKVPIRKSTLQGHYRNLNQTCLDLGFGQSGFLTYHMGRTIDGMEQFIKTADGGIDAPLFLTMQVNNKPSRKRPGNTDPLVNEKIQEALNERMKVVDKRAKMKLAILVNKLKETLKRMAPGGEQSWWDDAHITTMIPDNTVTRCSLEFGKPNARNCEDASFRFTGIKSVMVNPLKPLKYQEGNCVIIVQAKQQHYCILDVMRATIDSAISECIDGPNAPGKGAGIHAVFPSQSTSSSAAPSSTAQTEAVNVFRRQEDIERYKLPPTYQIFIYQSGSPGLSNGIMECADKVFTGNGTDNWVCQDEGIPEPEDPALKKTIFEAMGLPLVDLTNDTTQATNNNTAQGSLVEAGQEITGQEAATPGVASSHQMETS